MVKEKNKTISSQDRSNQNRSSRKRTPKNQKDSSKDKDMDIIQKGGRENGRESGQKGGDAESIEVSTLDSVDVNKFSISKYINKNIDWQGMPGAPPTDCNLM